LEALKTMETEIRRTSELDELLPGHPSPGDGGLWPGLLAELHAAYQQESDDAPLPVRYYLDWLYEALAEQRREKTLGRGVFLNTVHGAKGLAFEHVLILDGRWQMPAQRQKQEEERRLLYVGMTRARATLCLLELEPRGNPFIQGLTGDGILRRPAPAADPDRILSPARQYHIPGLRDLHLGYAGTFAPEHPIHAHLSRIQAGDRLHGIETNDAIGIHDDAGFCIARLSSAGRSAWSGRLSRIAEIRVLGMLRWSADDSREPYRHLARTPSWELPLMEWVLEEPPSGDVEPAQA
jgi:ATP-dependent DNA helicase RecQ